MRHKLAHDYYEVNKKVVWGVIEEHLEPLKNHLDPILKELLEQKNQEDSSL